CVTCQKKLADIYFEAENIEEAILWYKKASNNKDIESSYKLGLIYEDLNSLEDAKKYYLLAAQENHLNAKLHLGRIYYNEGNYEDSKKMLDICANENNAYAQHMVGLIYENYYSDHTNAKYWYEKSKNQGLVESIFNLGQISLKLDDDEMAKKYFIKGVELGNKDSEYMLAGLYLKKGRLMYKSLADEGVFNSKDIYESIPEFKLNVDSFLIPKFEEIEEQKDEEEEYIPNYILEIEENLDQMYESRIDKMLVETDNGYK
ncbi:tetratricopeptide repeat protein, partial [Intestinibacter sp.]|uniref:tetratricopeptide repeat protein n=1 Tax=Intestinibacter sp. TaxID=1965304 RepID=UPI002A753766